ncbi:MAG: DNA translocase FtsK [Gammaproteobacteria bacterium]|nr:DNA translocase FtsK [Gammaproteobacteria bacterium]
MNNNYIPEVFKDKLSTFFNYVYGSFLLILTIILTLSLFTFDIGDNSLLTSTNNPTQNILSSPGAFTSSFIFYTFGIMGFLLILFFFTFSFLIFLNKNPKFLFIRLTGFLISLVLIPQSLLFWNLTVPFHPEIELWGGFSKSVYLLHEINIISFILSSIGLILFFFSQNLFKFIRLPKLNFKNLSKQKNYRSINIKKDPVIRNHISGVSEEDNTEISNVENNDRKNRYLSPSLDILESSARSTSKGINNKNIDESSNLLEKVFSDFNIDIKVINVKLGPVITLFEILPSAGTKINTIINLAGDISRSMGVGAVRIAQIYGTQFLGVEVPNSQREPVTIKELLSNENFKKTFHKIPICIGKDISGNIEVIDLSKTPHLLVAGTTGSGKSVFINTLLASILYKFSPKELRLILIDPKMLELSVYNDIAHLLTPVVTEPKKAIIALKWVCKEMERRYSLMNEENTRSLEGYNQKSVEKLPFIIVFIDEMADLMMTAGKEVEHYVQRLAQMARACGIHLVMATQRPSVDIITGSIKANFPSRISFQVASKYDSRTVLGEIGAEQLLGNGDMLMSKNGSNLIRYQSAFISDDEVNKLIKEIKKSQKVEYLEELDEIIKNNDENFDSLSDEDEELITKSIDLIKSSNKASTSYLQRNFQIGYNKAARVMEALEQRGVVSQPNHAGKREILINS